MFLELDAAEERCVDDGRVLRRYGRGDRDGCLFAEAGEVERAGVGGASSIGVSIAGISIWDDRDGHPFSNRWEMDENDTGEVWDLDICSC